MRDNDLTDRAFSGASPFGMIDQDTYSGALSFLRRPYSKDLTGADVVVSGVPYDLAVSNRPGTRSVRSTFRRSTFTKPIPRFDRTEDGIATRLPASSACSV